MTIKENVVCGIIFVLFMVGTVFLIDINQPPLKTFKTRMETCDFPSYQQQLECAKIKAIRGEK